MSKCDFNFKRTLKRLKHGKIINFSTIFLYLKTILCVDAYLLSFSWTLKIKTRLMFNVFSALMDTTRLDVYRLKWCGGEGAQMKNFVWPRRRSRPPGSSHSFGPAPHVTTSPWPPSLLTSCYAFSHRLNDAPPMTSLPHVLIQPLPLYLIYSSGEGRRSKSFHRCVPAWAFQNKPRPDVLAIWWKC